MELEPSTLDPQKYILYSLVKSINTVSRSSHRIFIEHGEKLEEIFTESGMELVEYGIRYNNKYD